MSSTSDGALIAEQRPSLRERKKLATRVAIRRAAFELIAERGYSGVTVEDIAAAADVAPRTFFNYFPSKEAVLLGSDPSDDAEVRDRLVHDQPGHSALEVLRAVIADRVRSIEAELAELGGDASQWASQIKAAHADPQLGAARAAHMAQTEARIAAAVAERLGTDAERDPYPLMLVSAAMGVLRAALSFWASVGGTIPLEELTDAAYQTLADGFPEDCALRGLTRPADPTASQPAGCGQQGKDQTR